MRTSLKILTIATALVVGLAAAPAIYAQSTGTMPTPMAGKNKMPMSQQGQMGEGNMPMGQMGEGNMPMGQGKMMGMMKQMRQMMKMHTEMLKDHVAESSKKTQ